MISKTPRGYSLSHQPSFSKSLPGEKAHWDPEGTTPGNLEVYLSGVKGGLWSNCDAPLRSLLRNKGVVTPDAESASSLLHQILS